MTGISDGPREETRHRPTSSILGHKSLSLRYPPFLWFPRQVRCYPPSPGPLPLGGPARKAPQPGVDPPLTAKRSRARGPGTTKRQSEERGSRGEQSLRTRPPTDTRLAVVGVCGRLFSSTSLYRVGFLGLPGSRDPSLTSDVFSTPQPIPSPLFSISGSLRVRSALDPLSNVEFASRYAQESCGEHTQGP